MLLFGGVVAHIDLGTELHFLGFDLALVLTRLLGLDSLVVLELTVVHDATYWRLRLRCDLNQVIALIIGDALGLLDRIDPQLRPIIANQATFLNPDSLIEPWFLSCYGAHLLLSLFRCYHARTILYAEKRKTCDHTIAGHTNSCSARLYSYDPSATLRHRTRWKQLASLEISFSRIPCFRCK